MDLTVVIPARNEEDNLPRQLSALTAQSWEGDWEIVVVDNGSTDNTAAVVMATAAVHPRVRLVSESTLGLCHARNAGIAAARGRSVAICDADDVVANEWVAAMGAALATHPLVTGSEELSLLNPDWLAASRGQSGAILVPTFHGIFPFPNGNNFGLHRSLVETLGGFDQDFIGAEDVEFGLRAWLAGVDLHYEPNALVHYAYRRLSGELWRQGLGYGRPRPAIARRLVEVGCDRPSMVAGWKSWAWLVLNAPRAVTSEGRAGLAWVAGNRFGHLLGSVRHRTVLL